MLSFVGPRYQVFYVKIRFAVCADWRCKNSNRNPAPLTITPQRVVPDGSSGFFTISDALCRAQIGDGQTPTEN